MIEVYYSENLYNFTEANGNIKSLIGEDPYNVRRQQKTIEIVLMFTKHRSLINFSLSLIFSSFPYFCLRMNPYVGLRMNRSL